MDYAQRLQKIGLTEGESRVYLALLQTGSSTVGPIAKKSKVAYSKIYDVLSRLQEKGLVSTVVKSETKHFQAVQPYSIKSYIEKKEQQLTEQKTELQKLAPELELLSKLSENNLQAEIFTGWKGIEAAHKKITHEQKEFLFFYTPDKGSEIRAHEYFWSINPKLKKNSVVIRGICDRVYKTHPLNKQEKSILLRYVTFPIPNDMNICGNKIIIISWKIPMAVLITSQDIADNYRKMFEDIWKRGHT